MKKLICLTCLLLLVGCSSKTSTTSEEMMNINITIIDEINNKELFKGSIETNYELLADALENNEELKVVMEDSEYGKYIASMMDVAATDTNYWVYDSDNNDDCLEAGMCMGVSETTIEDGDNFIFTYTDTFE